MILIDSEYSWYLEKENKVPISTKYLVIGDIIKVLYSWNTPALAQPGQWKIITMDLSISGI